jgi:CheY-like chemotaxis protein
METKPMTALLVGESARSSQQLLEWLNKRGCHCQIATSYREACTLLSRSEFDLVLSQYRLPDRTAFPLLDWLIGSSTTLFLSTAVETGSLWLPMLDRGKRCVGAPLQRSKEFTEALQNVLDAKVRFDEALVPS